MGAKKGNRNAIKASNKWCIIKGKSEEGRIQYEVSDDVIDMRTIFYDFDTFEDAKKYLEEIKLEIRRKIDDSL
tara:strand:- start:25 stop:243 length:219 start_codon:yes stop_codon:yes gene_type:complete